MNRIAYWGSIFLFGGSAFGTTQALADEEVRPGSALPVPAGWIVSVGGNVAYEPRYAGAKIYGMTGLPQISFRRSDEPDEYAAPEDGLDYAILGDDTWAIGPVGNLRTGRYARLDRKLAGLHSYPVGVDAGLFAQVWIVRDHLRARVEVRQGLRGRDGLIADVMVDAVQKFGAFTLSLGPRLSFGDAPANRLEFGVNGRDSLQTGLPRYKPDAGLRSVGVTGAVSYDWSPEWRTTLYQRYDRVSGDVGASPLIRRFGSPDQFTVGLGFNYSFNVSGVP